MRSYIRKIESLVKRLKQYDDEGARGWLSHFEVLLLDIQKIAKERKEVAETSSRCTFRLQCHPSDVLPEIPANLRKAIKKMADSATISSVTDEIERTLKAMAAVNEVAEELDMGEDISMEWESGVEEYQRTGLAEIINMLGLPDAKLPNFNHYEDPNGDVDPWSPAFADFVKGDQAYPMSPRWHQWVGALAMIKRIMAGIPVMLMDDVGIGKTIQVLMVIALMQVYRRHYAEHKRFPGMFGECFPRRRNIVLILWFIANTKLDTPDGNLPDLPHIIAVPSGLRAQWEGEIKRFLRWGSFDLIPYMNNHHPDTRQPVWNAINGARPGLSAADKIILTTTTVCASPVQDC